MSWLAEHPQVFLAAGFQEYVAGHRFAACEELAKCGLLDLQDPPFSEASMAVGFSSDHAARTGDYRGLVIVLTLFLANLNPSILSTLMSTTTRIKVSLMTCVAAD
jgi:hypothetical protein